MTLELCFLAAIFRSLSFLSFFFFFFVSSSKKDASSLPWFWTILLPYCVKESVIKGRL